MKAIKTGNLTKKYKEVTAVNKLNLEINEGELFSLLGVNGAGKTTTIRMLSCLLKPTSGDAILLGSSINHDPQKIKMNINLSPQETAIASNLSVRENLEFIAQIYGIKKDQLSDEVEKSLTTFGLKNKEKVRASSLSGGQKRRLSIAMALITKPKILFLDEPTLGLDVLARRELWTSISALKGKITIVLTTHYMEEAEVLSDRIGIMVDGNLREVGTKDQLLKKADTDNFEEAFVRLVSEVSL